VGWAVRRGNGWLLPLEIVIGVALLTCRAVARHDGTHNFNGRLRLSPSATSLWDGLVARLHPGARAVRSPCAAVSRRSRRLLGRDFIGMHKENASSPRSLRNRQSGALGKAFGQRQSHGRAGRCPGSARWPALVGNKKPGPADLEAPRGSVGPCDPKPSPLSRRKTSAACRLRFVELRRAGVC
jgi:hypothetical protein